MSVSGKSLLFGALLCAILIATECQKEDKHHHRRHHHHHHHHRHLEVNTQSGRIRGKEVKVKGSDRRVVAFLGLRYAVAPVGDRRYARPQPERPWQGVRDATRHGAICRQELSWIETTKKIQKARYPRMRISDDCLNMDIYTADTRGKNKSIIIWLNGGQLSIGGAAAYDGAVLASRGEVVVVIINYRTNMDGFFSTGSSHAPGNMGLHDIRLAVRWMKANGQSFGGNPNSMTIAGQGEGGSLAHAMMLSPYTRGFFQRGISQSGTALHPGFFINDRNTISRYWRRVAQVSFCPENKRLLISCLREKSAEELARINREMLKEIGYFPIVQDGVFFHKTPKEYLDQRDFSTVPYLLGMNNDEFGFYISQVYNEPDIISVEDRDQAAEVLRRLNKKYRWGLTRKQQKKALKWYFREETNDENARILFLRLLKDFIYKYQALRAANYHTGAGANVYLYYFKHRPHLYRDTKPGYVKADHFDEVGFVHGGPFSYGATVLADATEEEKRLSKNMMKLWTAFVRNGQPNGRGSEHTDDRDSKWKKYGRRGNYLKITLKMKHGKRLGHRSYKFWKKNLKHKKKEEK